MKRNFYENSYINTIKPYYFLYNGQRYNAAYYNGNILFGIKHPDYLSFEAIDTCQIGWYKKSEKVLYSYDKINWLQFPYVPQTVVYIPGGDYPDSYFITLNPGDKIFIMGTDEYLSASDSDYYTFMQKGNGKLKCGGDMSYLVDDPSKYTWLHSYGYYRLFMGLNITTAPKLPRRIFSDLSVEDVNLHDHCFHQLFRDCIYLKKSPIIYNYAHLSATHVYDQMFYGCSSLNEITYLDDEGPSTADSNYWVTGVAANGTFYSTEMKTYSADSGVPLNWERVII